MPILQASTSEVYGDPAVHPQTEAYWGNVNPIGPRSCYDEGNVALKHCSSITIGSTSSKSKSRASLTTYGPRMHPADGRVVSNFIVQALNGEPITLYGDGPKRAPSATSAISSTD